MLPNAANGADTKRLLICICTHPLRSSPSKAHAPLADIYSIKVQTCSRERQLEVRIIKEKKKGQGYSNYRCLYFCKTGDDVLKQVNWNLDRTHCLGYVCDQQTDCDDSELISFRLIEAFPFIVLQVFGMILTYFFLLVQFKNPLNPLNICICEFERNDNTTLAFHGAMAD